MLRCAARVPCDDPVLGCALEETFALHLFNLERFLYGDTGAECERDLVLAEDYLGRRWLELRPERTPLFDRLVAWAERRIGRVGYAAPAAFEAPCPSSLVEASFEVQKVMDTFISNLPRRLLGSKWRIHYETGDS